MQMRIFLPPAFAILAGLVAAQSNPASSASDRFEVASIRPAAVRVGHEGGKRSRIEHTPKSLTMWNVDLNMCLQWAYGVQSFQIATAHVNADSYDILARTGTEVPLSQLRMMLRDLLATRFKIVLHRENRSFPVYELVEAKSGAKLTPTRVDTSHPQVHTAESLPRIEGDSFLFSGVTMTEFAAMLSQLRGIDLPVVDRTGVAGTFDIVLPSAPIAAREADTGALMASVQQQLGLKLASSKAPFEVIVIDHAEKPSEN